jgi:hypothetical protein
MQKKERRNHVIFFQKATAGNLLLFVPTVYYDIPFCGRDDRFCFYLPTGDESGS